MIAAFTRLDLSSWFPRTQTLLTLLFIVVVGVLLPIPGMAVMAAGVVTSLMVSAPFLGDERGHLDTLYGVLPVSRGTVVVGRALSVVSYYLVAAALATAVTFVTAVVRGTDVPGELLLIAHAAAFAFIGLSMSLQLPVLFRIGYSRGRLISYAPAFVVAGGAWLVQALGGSTQLQSVFADVPVPVFAGVGAAIGALGIIAAVVIAVRSYRTREL
jgi:hypothetical protein